MLRKLYTAWWKWRLRKYAGDDTCCCGEVMGTGGSICAHGGCRSAYEYAVTSRVDAKFPRVT